MKPNKCNCGQHPEVINLTTYISDKILGHYVYCPYCRKVGRIMSTPEGAVAAWNEEEENK